MRITFVLDHAGISGGVRVVGIYARRLQQRGHDVQIVSRHYRFPKRRDRLRAAANRLWRAAWRRGAEPSHLDGLDMPHRVLPAGYTPSADDFPDADIVIATWWETAEWVAALPPSKGAKVYFVQHYEVHRGQPVDRVKATWRLPLQKIAVSQWLVDLARDNFGDPRAMLVPNSVDLEQFDVPPRGMQQTPTVGMLYHPAHYKGVDICIRAVELARRTLPELRMVAFGGADPVAELPLPGRAEFFRRPAQDELPLIYANCDAWLFGSRSEGFGLPILEAMACRTPVVATPAGAAPELVGRGGGVLVKPENSPAMAEGLLHVLSQEEAHWREMSDAAHRTAASYSWDDATDLFERALIRTTAEEGDEGAEATRLGHPARQYVRHA